MQLSMSHQGKIAEVLIAVQLSSEQLKKEGMEIQWNDVRNLLYRRKLKE